MILYQLVCDAEHRFEAWFASSEAFDRQSKGGVVTCPTCESAAVRKAIMAPRVRRPKGEKAPGKSVSAPAGAPSPAELRKKLLELRAMVEANCDYVGERFAEEARRIHYEETEPRGIYGESTEEERAALSEEGVPVATIPWIPHAADN